MREAFGVVISLIEPLPSNRASSRKFGPTRMEATWALHCAWAVEAGVFDLLASLSHALNMLRHIITKESHVLSKFTIPCWATFTAILGHMWPRPQARVGRPPGRAFLYWFQQPWISQWKMAWNNPFIDPLAWSTRRQSVVSPWFLSTVGDLFSLTRLKGQDQKREVTEKRVSVLYLLTESWILHILRYPLHTVF